MLWWPSGLRRSEVEPADRHSCAVTSSDVLLNEYISDKKPQLWRDVINQIND